MSTPTKTSATPKKPTLSQQVKSQAAQIEQLSAQLQKKEEELIALAAQAQQEQQQLQDQLQQTELAAQDAGSERERQAKKVTTVTRKLSAKEQQIKQLTAELTQKLVRAEEQLTDVSSQQQDVQALNIVNMHIIAGMALGLLPLPIIDVAALTGVQLNLLRSLCKHNEVEFDEQQGKAFLHALVSGSAPVVSVMGLSSVLKVIPGIGTIGGGISMVVLSGASLYAVGQVFIRHFNAGGTLQDFTASQWQVFFKEKLQEGKLQAGQQVQNVKQLAKAA